MSGIDTGLQFLAGWLDAKKAHEKEQEQKTMYKTVMGLAEQVKQHSPNIDFQPLYTPSSSNYQSHTYTSPYSSDEDDYYEDDVSEDVSDYSDDDYEW